MDDVIGRLENLYKNNRKKYVNIINRILGDYAGAEDIVQEAFTRAVDFCHSYDPQRGELQTWFNKIMFNALRDYQRERQGQHIPADDFSVADVLPAEGLRLSPDMSGLIVESIKQVRNEKHQRILELFFILGYTSTEINQIEEKVSVSNVTTIVNRFRGQLIGELKWR